jgi:hypothetical protein
VKAKAALEEATLKEMLTWCIRTGLREPTRLPRPTARRSTLPVVAKRGKGVILNLTPEFQALLEEEEYFAKLHRSFGC